MAKYEQWQGWQVLVCVTVLTLAGLGAAVCLFIWAPGERGAAAVGTLFAFLGPVLSVLLLILRNQERITAGINGNQQCIVEAAAKIAHLEAMVHGQAGSQGPPPPPPPVSLG